MGEKQRFKQALCDVLHYNEAEDELEIGKKGKPTVLYRHKAKGLLVCLNEVTGDPSILGGIRSGYELTRQGEKDVPGGGVMIGEPSKKGLKREVKSEVKGSHVSNLTLIETAYRERPHQIGGLTVIERKATDIWAGNIAGDGIRPGLNDEGVPEHEFFFTIPTLDFRKDDGFRFKYRNGAEVGEVVLSQLERTAEVIRIHPDAQLPTAA